MRGRDVLLLAACGLGIVFSFSAHGSLELVLTWRHDIDTRTFSNRHYPLDSERLPTPIIAGLRQLCGTVVVRQSGQVLALWHRR